MVKFIIPYELVKFVLLSPVRTSYTGTVGWAKLTESACMPSGWGGVGNKSTQANVLPALTAFKTVKTASCIQL